jgi:hypothetical protein
MSERIQHFIESLIEDFGLTKVILFPFALVPVVAAFGWTSGPELAGALSGSVALLESFILLIALAARLRLERGSSSQRDKVILRLTHTILDEQTESSYTWEYWKDRVAVSAGGDMTSEEWRTLRVGRARPLRVLWAAKEQTPEGSLVDRDRRRVRVQVNSLDIVNGQSIIGASYDVAGIWETPDAFVIYFCPDKPVPPRGTLRVYVKWIWPGYYRQLVQGGIDEVYYERKRGTVKSVELDIVFDKSCELRGPMRTRPIGGTAPPRQNYNADGSLSLHVSYESRSFEGKIGFVLDNSPHETGET